MLSHSARQPPCEIILTSVPYAVLNNMDCPTLCCTTLTRANVSPSLSVRNIIATNKQSYLIQCFCTWCANPPSEIIATNVPIRLAQTLDLTLLQHLYQLKFSSSMLDFLGKLLDCTALSPVQSNNFPKKLIVSSFVKHSPRWHFPYFLDFSEEGRIYGTRTTTTETHARAHRLTLTKAGFCVHKEVSAYGRGRVWPATLHSDSSLRLE